MVWVFYVSGPFVLGVFGDCTVVRIADSHLVATRSTTCCRRRRTARLVLISTNCITDPHGKSKSTYIEECPASRKMNRTTVTRKESAILTTVQSPKTPRTNGPEMQNTWTRLCPSTPIVAIHRTKNPLPPAKELSDTMKNHQSKPLGPKQTGLGR